MNPAVGRNCPKWMCPEAPDFVAWHPEDEDLSDEFEDNGMTEDGLESIAVLCRDYEYEYRLFWLEKSRGLVFPEKRGGRYYMKREEFEAFIHRPKSRGRPYVKRH